MWFYATLSFRVIVAGLHWVSWALVTIGHAPSTTFMLKYVTKLLSKPVA